MEEELDGERDTRKKEASRLVPESADMVEPG